jgi:hypothetical protein
MNPPESEPPQESFQVANFADSLVQHYVRQGGDAKDLFIAFAGLVAAVSAKTAADCLIALDEAMGSIAAL